MAGMTERKIGKALVLYLGSRRHVAFRAYLGRDDGMAIESWLERDAGDFFDTLMTGGEGPRKLIREMIETAAGGVSLESLPLYVVFSICSITNG